MEKYPKWGDKVSVHTWGKETDRLFALRDFEIINKGDSICRGTTTWIVLDIKSNRPQKIEEVFRNFIDYLYKDAIKEKPYKIDDIFPCEKINKITVQYSDIDVNKHVNNVKYVE